MLFFAILGLIYFIRLRQFSDPSGVDGYFYLQQIKKLSEFAPPYYKDYSLAFIPPSVLNFFVRDPLLTYQITTSLVFAAIGWISTRIVTKHYGKSFLNRFFVLPLGLTYFAYNPLLIDLNFTFLKTATACLALLFGVEALLDRKLLKSAAAFVIATLCHKLVAVLVAVLLLCFALSMAKRKLILIAAIPAFAVLLAAFLFYPGLHEHVAAMFDNFAFTVTDLSEIWTKDANRVYLLVTALFGFLFLVWSLLSKFPHRWLNLFFGFLMILPAAFPDTLNTDSVSFRLLLISAIFTWMALAVLMTQKISQRCVGVLAFVSLMGVNLHFLRPLNTWINAWSTRIQNEDKLVTLLPPNALLYAPHGLEFYLAYKTPFRPRSLIVPPNGRPVFRIAYVKPYMAANNLFLNDLLHVKMADIGNEFILLTDENWALLNIIHKPYPLRMNQLPRKPDFVADYD